MKYPCDNCSTKFERYSGKGKLCINCWNKSKAHNGRGQKRGKKK